MPYHSVNPSTINLGIDLAYRLGIIKQDPVLRNIIHLYRRLKASGVTDRNLEVLLRSRLSPVFRAAAHNRIRLLFNFPEKTAGDIHIGNDPFKKAVLIMFKDLRGHVLIVASTTSGKTVLMFVMIRSLLDYKKSSGKGFSFHMYDYVKNDFLNLIPMFERFNEPVYVIDRTNLFFNPLNPQGRSISSTIEQFTELLAFCFSAQEPTRFAVRKVSAPLYQKGVPPTLGELRESVQNDKEINEGIRINLASKLDGLFAALPQIKNCRYGYSYEDLAHRNIIWSLPGMGIEIQNFIVFSYRQGLFSTRVERRYYRAEPDLINFDDEAWRLFKSGEHNSLSRFTATQRALGIAQVLGSQTPDLDSAVVGNTNIRIGGRLTTLGNINTWGGALALNSEQKNLLIYLRPGEFIIKINSETGHPYPFVFKAPLVQIQHHIDDAEIKRRADALVAELKPDISVSPPVINPEASRKDNNLSKDELSLLKNAYKNPVLILTRHYRDLGLNNRRGTEAVKGLNNKNLIKLWNIETGAPGRSPKIIQILDEGYEIINEKPIENNGRGGFFHELCKTIVANFYKNEGYAVEIEFPLGGSKTIDLIAVKENEKIAAEIEISGDHCEENILKILPLKYSKIIVVYNDRAIRNRYEKKYSTLGVTFTPIYFYHNTLYNKKLH
ncbi:MAG: hypothetical protein V1709_10270 [Planctomycetota bacterium]